LMFSWACADTDVLNAHHAQIVYALDRRRRARRARRVFCHG